VSAGAASAPSTGAADRLAVVEARLLDALQAAGRRREEITIVAVSKTRPAADVAELAALGVRDFGENRWQELAPKAAEVAAAAELPPTAELRWHFVGRLQRNKARGVAATVVAVHSLDRADLCAPLARGAAAAGRALDVFVQVSLDGDPKRGGVVVDELPALADGVAACAPHLRLVGLMAVPPRETPPRPAFARLRALSERLQVNHPGASSLSAGMSADLEDAVAEGATHLRIGTALFGSRA
jgi:pyridoxal phosphate enzyme (YggS family)